MNELDKVISVAMKETDDIKKYFHDLEQIWEQYVVYEQKINNLRQLNVAID